ncbi:MAG: ABC transporter permease [Nitriliruptor sp.]
MPDETRRLRRSLLLREAWRTVAARPGAAVLSAAATTLGIALLVLTVGLTATAERRVAAGFDALRATEVLLTPTGPDQRGPTTAELARAARISGVEAVGVLAQYAPADATVTGRPTHVSVDPASIDHGAVKALQLDVDRGSAFDPWLVETGLPAVLVGAELADRLGGVTVDGTSSISVGGVQHLVAGILSDSPRRPSLRDTVLVPHDPDGRDPATLEIVLRTQPGAAQQVADLAPLALGPTDPGSWTASAPPDPDTLRVGIESGVRNALLGVSAAVVVIAGLSIGNATFVSVLQRRREIGVRRAMGATAGHVRLQILTEAALVGGLGGIAGSSVGILALVVIANLQRASPVMPAFAVPAAAGAGILLGLLAGIFPARSASRLEPVEAMRAG